MNRLVALTVAGLLLATPAKADDDFDVIAALTVAPDFCGNSYSPRLIGLYAIATAQRHGMTDAQVYRTVRKRIKSTVRLFMNADPVHRRKLCAWAEVAHEMLKAGVRQ